jgi:hypothetical protein
MDADAFAVVAGALRGVPDFDGRINRLVQSTLLMVSADGSAWELDSYDRDAPRDVKRGRDESEYPPGQSRLPRLAAPDAAPRGEMPRLAAPCARDAREGKARQGKELPARIRAQGSEPSPSGSTDARAIRDSVPAAPPPALEAREAQREAWGDDYAIAAPPEPPPPRPPPRLLTRAEEAARTAELRAQFARLEAGT